MASYIDPVSERKTEPEENASSSKVLADKSSYGMPPADAGIVQDRSLMIVPAANLGTAYYSPGDTIRFDISVGEWAIDPVRSYLSLQLQLIGNCVGADATAADNSNQVIGNCVVHMPIGIQGLFESVTTACISGSDNIEMLERYNFLAGLRDRLIVDPFDIDTALISEGWCPVLIPLMREPAFPTSAGSTLANNAGSGTLSDHAFSPLQLSILAGYVAGLYSASGANYTCRLRHSGIWGADRFILMNQLGRISLSIKLASVRQAFSYFQLAGSDTDMTKNLYGNTASASTLGLLTYANPSGEKYAANATDAAETADSATWLAAKGSAQQNQPALEALVSSYRVRNVNMVLELAKFSKSYNAGLDEAAKQGIPWTFTTYHFAQTPAPVSSSTSMNYQIPVVKSNIISCIGVQVCDSQADQAMGGYLYKYWQRCVVSWRFRLGGYYYPAESLPNDAVRLREVLKALPQIAGRNATIPRYKYSWRNFEAVHLNPGAGTKFGNLAAIATALVQPRLQQAPAAEVAAATINASGLLIHGTANSYTNVMGTFNQQHWWQPNQFMVAARFQLVPGVMMTGQSTSAGNQLFFECTYATSSANDLSTDAEGTAGRSNNINNSRFAQQAQWYFVTAYTRSVVIGSNGYISIKE